MVPYLFIPWATRIPKCLDDRRDQPYQRLSSGKAVQPITTDTFPLPFLEALSITLPGYVLAVTNSTQVFPRLSRPQKQLIITWLSRLLKIHDKVSKSDTNVATAFIARYIRKTLNIIAAESRVPSRANTPGFMGNGSGGGGMDFGGQKGAGEEGMIIGGGEVEVEQDLFESLGLVSCVYTRLV